MKPTRIVIFAKAPLPGLAKTRLIPALGAEGAARLARRMLETTVANALAANVGPVELCVTPDIDSPVWQSINLPQGLEYSSQGEGDLGTPLACAAQRVIAQGESVLLIGTDIPALDAKLLQRAASLLNEVDATLFSTADGGYALLGLNRFHISIFRGIAWSTKNVAFATLCHIGRLGWSVRNGPMLRYIDKPGDLKWLPAEWHPFTRENEDIGVNHSGESKPCPAV